MTEINRYIDHTLLKANATRADIVRVCDEAKHFHTASVCINSCWVRLVHELLAGSDVKTCTVVGFPLGAMSTAAKAEETRLAVRDGAEEIDMVINVGYVKAGEWDAVKADIAAVVAACGKSAIVKVILENCLLTDDEKMTACQAAKTVGAAFVKTSTGFSSGGATVEDIALMRKTVGPDMGVKAAGGVRTRAQAEAMIAAGATRIGASATKAIVEGD
ncbi:MAG: deoxyribose-phosphate aldolase [Clostridia bacterium]